MNITDETANSPVITVSALTDRIKEYLEIGFSDVWVSGEITNLTIHQSGHVYFTLVDAGARLSAVVFRSQVRFLLAAPASLKSGDKVICHGRLDLYPPQGAYKLVVDQMKRDGLGDLMARLEERKQRLAAEGLFAPERKKTLPRFPRTVGLVTGGQSAAVEDMIRILTDRWPVRIRVYPALVQGDAASAELCAGLATLDSDPDVDVIILGRGGGAFEELLPFSDEAVVRCVAACAKPVVSAVGHEIDNPICDLAADVRAPTPTAAAQLVVPDRHEVAAWFEGQGERLQLLLERRMAFAEESVGYLAQSMERNVTVALSNAANNLQLLDARLNEVHPRRWLEVSSERISHLEQTMNNVMAHLIALRERSLVSRAELLNAIAPTQLLLRGFGIIRDMSGKVVKSVNDVTLDSKVSIMVSDGSMISQVVKIDGANK